MADLVSEAGAWIWAVAGLCAISASVYGGIRVVRRWKKAWRQHRLDDFAAAVTEVVAPLLEPVNDKLEHLHDCVERVGQAALVHAATASYDAGQARDAAAETKTALDAHAATMRDHIEADAGEFASLTEWRKKVDVDLSNIQNAQQSKERGSA